MSFPDGFPLLPSRRRFLATALPALVAAGAGAGEKAAASGPASPSAEHALPGSGLLPTGPEPEPVELPHFPDKLHAFVWRNWPLVTAERMAATVGASAEDIRALGAAMGLPGSAPPAGAMRRGALTIIRRNWHLLPWDQLLTLLDWTAEELAFTLREDDFFYIKLGSLKPRCPELRWSAPGPEARQAAEQIRRIMDEEFPDRASRAGDSPLFSFVAETAALPAGEPPAAPPRTDGQEDAPLRLCYSWFGLYGDPLLHPELDPYPDGLLMRLRTTGVNAVWLPVMLTRLAPFPWEPARSDGHEARLANLRILTERAARHGIRIHLYLNEPRMLPEAWFAARPELRGVSSGGYAALCTSVPAVRDWLSGAVEHVCRAVPELGGFFSITASENPTNCWSHGQGTACPRCGPRGAAEVIAEVNSCFARGIRQAGGRQQLRVWDWGWGDWAEAAIAALPMEAVLMSVSEWDLPLNRGGISTRIGEYCLSAAGPGPRALRHWKAARARGLKVTAKIQAALSWEFSAAPWLPVPPLAVRHAEALKDRAGVTDLMLGWTLGGCPSPNFEALATGLEATARRRAGARAPALLTFWEACSQAFGEFPFHVGTVYQAPFQFGPSNLLWEKPTGYKAAMVGLAYDDLESWRAVYPAEIFIRQLEKTAEGFRSALDSARAAFPDPPPPVAQELDYAEAALLHWRSTASQARYILVRQTPEARPERTALLRREIADARRLHALQSRDARIGFEASNQYYYTPLDLAEKVLCCRRLLDTDNG